MAKGNKKSVVSYKQKYANARKEIGEYKERMETLQSDLDEAQGILDALKPFGVNPLELLKSANELREKLASFEKEKETKLQAAMDAMRKEFQKERDRQIKTREILEQRQLSLDAETASLEAANIMFEDRVEKEVVKRAKKVAEEYEDLVRRELTLLEKEQEFATYAQSVREKELYLDDTLGDADKQKLRKRLRERNNALRAANKRSMQAVRDNVNAENTIKQLRKKLAESDTARVAIMAEFHNIYAQVVNLKNGDKISLKGTPILKEIADRSVKKMMEGAVESAKTLYGPPR